MLRECHSRVPFLDQADEQRIGRPDAGRLGGAPLLELPPAGAAILATLGPATPLRALADACLDTPVGTTIGTLRTARYLDRRCDGVQAV
jgi:hypothetical protein